MFSRLAFQLGWAGPGQGSSRVTTWTRGSRLGFSCPSPRRRSVKTKTRRAGTPPAITSGGRRTASGGSTRAKGSSASDSSSRRQALAPSQSRTFASESTPAQLPNSCSSGTAGSSRTWRPAPGMLRKRYSASSEGNGRMGGLPAVLEAEALLDPPLDPFHILRVAEPQRAAGQHLAELGHLGGPIRLLEVLAPLEEQLVDLAELPGGVEAHVDVQLRDELVPQQQAAREGDKFPQPVVEAVGRLPAG